MTKSKRWSWLCLFCLATAIAARTQNFETVASLGSSYGYTQYGSLVQGSDGSLYGATVKGGSGGAGIVFEISAAGDVTIVCDFGESTCPDGAQPFAGLIRGADGNLYGTAWQGNASGSYVTQGSGTVFEITAGGQPITLYGFCSQTNCADGGDPLAPLVQAADGSFYGTTFDGGSHGYGTLYRLTTSGTLTTLHSFRYADGAGPVAGLIQAKDGTLYGTTLYGGAHGAGTVFSMTPAGKVRTLHSFGAVGDGASPYAALVQASDGNLYGTTHDGGAHGHGTVFQVITGGKVTVLYSFCSQKKCADGASPYAGLIQATNGNLYGTTSKGGDTDWGTLYAITPTGQLTTLHSFCGQKNCTDGADPVGGLLQASDGNMYGTTAEGGIYESGTVFRLSLGSDSLAETVLVAGETALTSNVDTSVPLPRDRLPHVADPSAHAPAPPKPGAFNCSPAPCVLPPTQASEGGSIVTDPILVVNPQNQKELMLASADGNCSPSLPGFHVSRDGGATWNRVLCMPFVFAKNYVYIPLAKPWVAYDRHGTAYVSGTYFDNEGQGTGFDGVQKSHDGTHWSQPVVALGHAGKRAPRGGSSLAVDGSPSSRWVNRVYIADVTNRVLVSHSSDGGTTWKQVPVTPAHGYDHDELTRMAIGNDGTVYLVWLHCPDTGPDRRCTDGTSDMVLSKSSDGGDTWSLPRVIANPVYPPSVLSNTKILETLNWPAIAIDNSSGPHAGNLYAAMFSWTGTYMRVQVIRSSDGGNRWSSPVAVAPLTAIHDQFFPALSLSPKGWVGVSWLDRRNDPADHNYQAFAAISTDGGKTFRKNWQLTKAISNPDNSGAFAWMGDYAGNTWVGNKFIAAWMDSSNGVDMQEVIGGVRLK